MLVRIISALVGCCIIIPVFIFSDTWVFPIFMALVTAISMFEMLRCIGVHKKYYLSVPVIAFSAAVPVAVRLTTVFGGVDVVLVLLAGVGVSALYFFGISLFSKGDFPIEKAALTFMTSFYIIGGYTAIVILRDMKDVGGYLYLLVFLGAWMTDIFAYFTGRLLGRHKLIPEVSPKKTVEGSIGGIVFCVLSYLAYGFVLEKFFGQDVSYLLLGAVAVVISVVSQIGDLTMSLIKRNFGIKDYGRIMPGHGGLLDRFDSTLAVAIILVIACGIIDSLGGGLINVL